MFNPNEQIKSLEEKIKEKYGSNDKIDLYIGGLITALEKEIEPIPLTEEILLKCGFVKLRETEYTSDTYQLYGINIWIKNNKQPLLLDRFIIHYLHELQQAIRLLTGK